MSEYEFDQIMAEARDRLGRDRVLPVLEKFGREYGWLIPTDKRPIMATAVAGMALNRRLV